jgi:hypothetical protein
MVETNKMKFNKKYGFPKDEGHSVSEIAKLTGIKKSILDEVMSRGRGAHKSNPESVRSLDGKKRGGKSLKGKMSATQWGQARIYSFVMGGKTRTTADKDLWEKHKKSKKDG